MSVVLLSGGIDSIVCAELERRNGHLRGVVFVDYGHPAQVKEGWKAFAYHGSRGVPLKVVHAFGLNLGDMASESGARVVPGRNIVLLSLAANAFPGEPLVIGCNAADQADYPDCRREFLDAAGRAIGVHVFAPLLELRKDQIIRIAKNLGLSRADAWSCYLGEDSECGKCPSCIEAASGWANP